MATTRAALAGPRVLLRQLREIMAEPIGAQERLDKIVTLIAANMVAEVCSVYVLRADGVLELYATEGLKRERRPPRRRCSSGEGLVGLIAAEARAAQPRRRAGASGLRLPAGDRRGDLPLLPRRAGAARRPARSACSSCRTATYRAYTEDEIEALQTTAMVLAEMIATGELRGPGQARRRTSTCSRPRIFEGRRPSPRASRSATSCCTSRASSSRNFIAEDIEHELQRLDAALGEPARSRSTTCWRAATMAGAGEHREMLEAYRMFANDRGWVAAAAARRSRNGLTAEAAVERVQSDTRARMHAPDRPVSARAAARSRRPRQPAAARADGPAARALRRATCRRTPSSSPATWGRPSCSTTTATRLRGLVLEEGGPTSHVAIVARALGIATVGQARRRRRRWRRPATPSSSTATPGEVHLRPHRRRRDGLCREGALPRPPAGAVPRSCATSRRSPATASRSRCSINAGLLVDLPHLDETGAAGIGLFRTELQFMIASSFPRLERAAGASTAQVLDAAGGRPVTFRTLDIGGDKVLPYLRAADGGEPGAGLAGDPPRPRPAGLLRTQVARAAEGGGRARAPGHVPDGDRAATSSSAPRRSSSASSTISRATAIRLPATLELGAMIEVPSLLFQLDELLPRGRFRLGRLQRPDPVPDGERPRQHRGSPAASTR